MFLPYEVTYLGRISFERGLEEQQRLSCLVQDGVLEGALMLLEHEPTVTLGRRTPPDQLLRSPGWFEDQGVALHRVDRGGKATVHAPGQLVGYPILRVEDPVELIRDCEGVLIDLLARLGISARSRSLEGKDFTGVWVEDRKIASIGLHVNRSVTTHGFALNVDMDMQAWQWIVPCGLAAPMTSVREELGSAPSVPELAEALSDIWSDRFALSSNLQGVA